MLNITLRDEFASRQMPGTAIALKSVADESPNRILEITYPTADIQTALSAISADRSNRPIVLIGERGRGKSHIMGVMHHAIQSPEKVEVWAQEWGARLESGRLQTLHLVRGYFPISEAVHNHEYPLLWDLLFARHPRGQYYEGRFKTLNQPYPPRSLLIEMFTEQPTALILDEFQKWFDGLSDEEGQTGRKWRELASNFIQNLSEIAKDHPDKLILVISVLNNRTEAFQQVHRDTPVPIDFRGATATDDRKKLILHRLFSNREQIPPSEIRAQVSAYAAERFRLRFPFLSPAEHERIVAEVIQAWPFSPELLDLLENQILMAEAAQETRDLIRILAQVFRAKGQQLPLITPADFSVDEDDAGVQSLLNSIATAGDQEKLRTIAQRNLEALRASGIEIPHAREVLSAIWMRSMSPSDVRGVTRQELQLDLVRDQALDDNRFRFELNQILDNSQNIHAEDGDAGRIWFGLQENPETQVKTVARNGKLWERGAASAVTKTYPGKDLEHIQRTLRHSMSSEVKTPPSTIIVLGHSWRDNPWSEVEEDKHPSRWNTPVLIVIPEAVTVNTDETIPELGQWLKTHVPKRRNSVRFLLPAQGSLSIYADPNLITQGRCSYLTTIEWKDDARYRPLRDKFDRPFRESLKTRYVQFAILRRWNYQQPELCVFEVQRVVAQGDQIPSAIEQSIFEDLFDYFTFREFVNRRAEGSEVMTDILDEIVEAPATSSEDAIPYLGDNQVYDQVLRIASEGDIALNVRGRWIVRKPEHSSDEALNYFRREAYTSGAELRAVQIGKPNAVGATTVNVPKPAPPVAPVYPPSTPPSGFQPPVTPTTVPPTPTIPQEEEDQLPPAPRKVSRSYRSEEPNTGINLSGYFERWNVGSDVTVSKATIEFDNLSVQQLRQILQRLPSSMRASLEISTDEDETQS